MNRPLIRPTRGDLTTSQGARSRKKGSPPRETHAEASYYLRQMAARTPMVIVLVDGEELRGTIEWYDLNCIKLNRLDAPNLLLPKHSIRYLFKEPRSGRG